MPKFNCYQDTYYPSFYFQLLIDAILRTYLKSHYSLITQKL
nr:MAG TPA_asm: hypothetical protein [Bacteriophage sp.]